MTSSLLLGSIECCSGQALSLGTTARNTIEAVGLRFAVQPSNVADVPQHAERIGDQIYFGSGLSYPVDRNLRNRKDSRRAIKTIDVERETSRFLPRKDRLRRIAAEHLEAALRVGNAFDGKQVDEEGEDAANDFPMDGSLDFNLTGRLDYARSDRDIVTSLWPRAVWGSQSSEWRHRHP